MSELKWSYTIKDSDRPPCIDTILTINCTFDNEVILEYTVETAFEMKKESDDDEMIRSTESNVASLLFLNKSSNGGYLLFINNYLPNPDSELKLNIPQDLLESLWNDLTLECI